MKDQRLQVFRDATASLIESLEAFVRLARWTDAEPKPESLVRSAAKLHDRLGAADRLSASRFHGPPPEMAKFAAMCTAMKRLDAAYLAYCRDATHASDKTEAATTLECEVSATAAGAHAWQT